MKAFILHDDPILATRVMAVLKRAIQAAEATALWTITLRPIIVLRPPTTARQVLAAAVDAHLVVFASCHLESLPLWVYEWLERWAVSRCVPDAALALTDGECKTELTDATSELSQLARKHQLTLIVNENSTVVKPPQPRLVKRSCPKRRWHIAFSIILAFAGGLLNLRAQQQNPPTNDASVSVLQLVNDSGSVWEGAIGDGFRSGAQSISFGAGANYGIAAFGSREAHDLALVNLTYGHMLSGVWGRGHWYQGNPEFRLELFTGAQFSPSSEWLVGLTPHLRYNFATGTHWIPYCDGGAGVTATGIGPPDLSGTFEFNLQAGGGVLWFLKDNMAITLDAHYVHWSCAGLHKPNLGLNGVTGMLGVTFFF